MSKFITVTCIVFTLLGASICHGHGGVSLLDDDVCIIKIGFLEAHFTGFQPSESGTEEFCEDIPKVSESVFVIDYLHDFLKEMPVDFRIVKDSTNLGYFASWEDLEKLGDLTPQTVFYQAAGIEREGIYTVNYQFEEPGMYIGIVTAEHPTEDKVYRAVFPFEVGGKNWGYLPFFLLLIVFAQLGYWYINRTRPH